MKTSEKLPDYLVELYPILKQEELNELPNGTPIVVWWEGGNGPGKYTIYRNKWGTAWFRMWKGDVILKDPVDCILCSGVIAIRLPEFYQVISPFCIDSLIY